MHQDEQVQPKTTPAGVGYNLSISRHVATIELNSPDTNNALSPEILGGITADLERLGKDKAIRAILWTSNLRGIWSVGGDLNQVLQFFEREAEVQKAAQSFALDSWLKSIDNIVKLMQVMRECPRPIVGRVQGIAYGNAVVFVALCDVSIALASSLFSFPEVRHGFAPVTLALASIDKLGSGPLLAWGMSGERYSAEEARAAGVVTKVVARMDELDGEVERYLNAFRKNSPDAMAAYKAGVNRLLGLDFHRLQALAKDGWFRLLTHGPLADSNPLEGLRAFHSQRKPRWDVSD
ncbi:MAG TPA: enoyl-CoA hydratase-related protein [Candidatus Xenobia bacterium]|jgi:enoyl-CoA hydratase/carnithine racemase